jgi:hypothetical protein
MSFSCLSLGLSLVLFACFFAMLRGAGTAAPLVCALGAGYSLVDGLAAGEAFFCAVPVSDGGFAHPPAEQDYATFDFAGKVEQAYIEIFDLDADGVDLGEGVFGALFCLGAFGLAAGDGDYVDVRATVEKDAVIERLHFALDLFHQLLAGDRGAQQGFQHGEQRLGFVESEGAVRHGACFYFNSVAGAAVGN